MKETIASVFGCDTRKVVLSAPKGGAYRKITLTATPQGFHVEKLTETQAFHETLTKDAALDFITVALANDFSQYTGWDGQWEYSLRITKKGKALTNKKPTGSVRIQPPNRRKEYLLPQGEVIEPLVDMGIFTKDGHVAPAMGDKYRQINRFLEQVEDETAHLSESLRIIDFGCGKSYLTFILYYYFTQIRGIEVEMTGLDLKADVIARCNETAKRYGYDGLAFVQGDINGYQCKRPPHMVISLHACDTATDFALANAVGWDAGLIFAVPCCQHEINAQMEGGGLALLTRYGLIQERVASLITDSIRGALLEACGYKTQLLEFIDMAHTPKNILIRAKKTNVPPAKRQEALAQARQLIETFHLDPTLYRLLQQEKLL